MELFNALATFSTFLVIAATATAAMVQLRHMRSANQIESINHSRQTFESTEYHTARNFVITELAKQWQDAAFRHQVGNRGARTPVNQVLITQIMLVANSHEQLGLLVKRRLIDRVMACDLFSANALAAWEGLAPVTVALRRTSSAAWENFEYFVVLSQDWLAAHPSGAYPPGVRRITIKDDLREADEQYAA
ncbi:MAG TPA: hypothetical protein VMS32_04870 [Verrucomicrobiae bacterium]|nr:hypothetical protein [Verrucomicrobiae bacterium]